MEQYDWPAEYAELTAADQRGQLPPEDLDRLAVAAFVLGHDDEVAGYRERAYESTSRAGTWCGRSGAPSGSGSICSSTASWPGRPAGGRGCGRLVPDDNSELSGLLLMADAALLMNTGDPAAGLPCSTDASPWPWIRTRLRWAPSGAATAWGCWAAMPKPSPRSTRRW